MSMNSALLISRCLAIRYWPFPVETNLPDQLQIEFTKLIESFLHAAIIGACRQHAILTILLSDRTQRYEYL